MWHEYERRKSKLRERLDEKYSEYIYSNQKDG